MTQEQARIFTGKQKTFVQDGSVLGSGQTAAVYPVYLQGRPDERYALKLLTDPALKDRFLNELDTLQTLKSGGAKDWLNPNGQPMIPRIEDYQDQGSEVFIVMTLAQGVPLDQIQREQGRFKEAEGLTILVGVARLFHLLHTKLRRSYLDWQPRNVMWERESQSMLVLDWNLLSPPGQADVAGDVAALGSMLYRMVVGVQIPAFGLSAAPGWADLTPGMQTILRQATHPDALERYPDAQALQQACEEQLDLWRNQDLQGLLGQADDLLKQIKNLLPNPQSSSDLPPGTTHKDLVRLVQQAHNLVTILRARQSELGRNQAILEGLAGDLTPYWTHQGSLIQRGLSLLSSGDATGAGEVFNDALRESMGDGEALEARRWILVAQTRSSDRAREAAKSACQALNQDRPQEALAELQALDQAGRDGRDPGVTGLMAEARARVNWSAYQQVREEASHASNSDIGLSRMETALLKLRDVKNTVDQLDPEHAILLRHHWGDLAQILAEAEAEIAELQKANSQYKEQIERIRKLDTLDALAQLKADLKEAPGNPRLAALAGENGLERLQERLQAQLTRSAPDSDSQALSQIQELLSLGLAHGHHLPQALTWRGAWHVAAALRDLESMLAGRLVGPDELTQIFTRIQQTGNPELQEQGLQAAATLAMHEAAQRMDPTLAAHVVETSRHFVSYNTQSELAQRQRSIENDQQQKLQKEQAQQAQTRTELTERIRRLLAGQHLDLAQEALDLLHRGDRLLAGDETWQYSRSGLEQQIQDEIDRLLNQSDSDAARQEIQKALDDIQARMEQSEQAEELRSLDEELRSWHQKAGTEVREMMADIDRLGSGIQQRINFLQTIQAPLQQAQTAYEAYTALPPNDPVLRTARLYKLAEAKKVLDAIPAMPDGPTLPALEELRSQIREVWHNQGFEHDPVNPANPVSDSIHTIIQVQAQQADRIHDLNQTVRTLPEWLTTEITQLGETLRKAMPKRSLPEWVVPTVIIVALVGGLIGVWGILNSVMPSESLASLEDVASLRDQTLQALETAIAPLQEGLLAQPAVDLDPLSQELRALREQVAGLPISATPTPPSEEEMERLRAEFEAQIEPTVTHLETISQTLAADVEALRQQVDNFANATPEPPSEQEMEVLRADALATAQAQIAPTVTALAVLSQTLTERENDLNKREAALNAEAQRLAEEEARLFPPLIEPGQIAFSFPPPDASLYVAPWQVVITATRWITPAEGTQAVNYRLTLNNPTDDSVPAILGGFFRTADAPLDWTYERSFAGEDGQELPRQGQATNFAFLDGFPGMSEEDAQNLGLNVNNQLPPGSYLLGLQAQIDNEWQTLPVTRPFTIRDDAEPSGGVVTGPGFALRRRAGPSASYASDRDSGFPNGGTNQVLFLGKTEGFEPDNQNQPTTWVLWQSLDEPIRRGWTASSVITPDSRPVLENLPDLAPPQPQ